MTTDDGFTLGVIGLGLMGGSIALALRSHARHVIAIDPAAETRQRALQQGLADVAIASCDESLRQCDLVILAAPVLAILHILEEIKPFLKPGCIVFDLGSTKAQIIEKMNALPQHIQAIGGHPMCGKVQDGLNHADGGLFAGKPFILARCARTTQATCDFVEALLGKIGANVVYLEAEAHDQLVALISHLPYLAAAGLAQTAAHANIADDLIRQTLGTGFKDTTRLAESQRAMMLSILLSNRQYIIEALQAYLMELNSVQSLLLNGREDELSAWVEQSILARRSFIQ